MTPDPPPPARGRIRPTGFELAVFGGLCLIWGSTWLAIKLALDGQPPVFGVAARFSLAAAALLTLLRLLPGRGAAFPRQPSAHLRIGLVGLVNFCLSYILVYQGEQYIPSGLTAVAFASFPFFVAGWAHLGIPGERLNRHKLAGILVGFTGVAVLFASDLGGGTDIPRGVALVTLAALLSAASNVYGKRLLRTHSVLNLNALGMLYGSLAAWVLWGVLEWGQTVRWTATGVAATVYLALAGSALAFVGYFWLLERWDTTRVAVMAFVTPVIALLLGWALLDETLTLALAGGSTLVLAGVALVVRGSASRHGPDPIRRH